MSRELPPPEFRVCLEDPGMAALLDHWCALRAGADGRMPPRRAVDPLAVPKLLQHLMIQEREASGRYRWRLTGTAVAAQLGGNMAGRYLDEVIPAESLAARMRLLSQVLDGGRPTLYVGYAVLPRREYKALRRLILPLADNDGRPAFVLSLLRFLKRREDAGVEEDVVEMIPPQTAGTITEAA